MSLQRRFVSPCARTVAVLLLLAATMSVAACSTLESEPTSEKAGDRFLGETEWRQEYADATRALTLPPGVVFPDGPETGGAQTFERGAGLVQAQAYWLYAWEREWLTQRGVDSARESAALRVLRDDVPACAFMTTYLDDDGRSLYAEYIQKAELGDPSGFQQDTEANPCTLVTVEQ